VPMEISAAIVPGVLLFRVQFASPHLYFVLAPLSGPPKGAVAALIGLLGCTRPALHSTYKMIHISTNRARRQGWGPQALLNLFPQPHVPIIGEILATASGGIAGPLGAIMGRTAPPKNKNNKTETQTKQDTLCYKILFPCRKSAFQAEFGPSCYRESTEIGPPAGRRTDFGVFPVGVRPKSGPEGRFPARKHNCVT
jgi:hypothetical protein